MLVDLLPHMLVKYKAVHRLNHTFPRTQQHTLPIWSHMDHIDHIADRCTASCLIVVDHIVSVVDDF